MRAKENKKEHGIQNKYSHASLNDGDSSEKCVVRQFYHCANIRMYLHKPR